MEGKSEYVTKITFHDVFTCDLLFLLPFVSLCFAFLYSFSLCNVIENFGSSFILLINKYYLEWFIKAYNLIQVFSLNTYKF